MDSDYFDELIGIHEDAINSFSKWWRVLLWCGVIILLLSVLAWILAATKKIESSLAPSLTTMFGTIISAASVLPYKEITPRRISIAKYKQLKRECERIKSLPADEQEKRMKDLNDILSTL
jgi:hypothetical protein